MYIRICWWIVYEYERKREFKDDIKVCFVFILGGFLVCVIESMKLIFIVVGKNVGCVGFMMEGRLGFWFYILLSFKCLLDKELCC